MAETFEPPIEDFFASMVALLLEPADPAPRDLASAPEPPVGLARPDPFLAPFVAAAASFTSLAASLSLLISSVSFLSRSLRPFYDADPLP